MRIRWVSIALQGLVEKTADPSRPHRIAAYSREENDRSKNLGGEPELADAMMVRLGVGSLGSRNSREGDPENESEIEHALDSRPGRSRLVGPRRHRRVRADNLFRSICRALPGGRGSA